LGDEIRVLIVDDHPVVREGLRLFLGGRSDIVVVGEAADGHEAIAEAGRLAPDVILLDLSMPGMGGIAALGGLKGASPASRILILTSSTSDDSVLPAIRGGASGFLLKDAAPGDLARAVITVAAGGSWLAPSAARRVVDEIGGPAAAGPVAALTPREHEVLLLIADGLANKDIATRLFVSPKTVKTHVSSILMKLEVSDRTQAALWAERHRDELEGPGA
jgi:DNA-binding NarL/FixJ family response regulator